MPRIEFDQQCSECGGTGLYSGMGEKKGVAVICRNCAGTGKYHFTYSYIEFTERVIKKNIMHVYEFNPGLSIGKGTMANGEPVTYDDFGGMPYKDWVKGKPFPKKSEMRKFSCPAWWYQCVNHKLKPEWEVCPGFGWFSDCKHFVDKEKCWERFDRENK